MPPKRELYDLISSSELENITPLPLFLSLLSHLSIFGLSLSFCLLSSSSSFHCFKINFLLSSVVICSNTYFPFLAVKPLSYCPICLILLMCFFPQFSSTYTHPILTLPPFLNWFQLLFPPWGCVTLCSVCSVMFPVASFYVFPPSFSPNWILPVALLHLDNKAYISGFIPSSSLPSHHIFLFVVGLITFPSYLRKMPAIILLTNIIASCPRAMNEICDENWHTASVQVNGF